MSRITITETSTTGELLNTYTATPDTSNDGPSGTGPSKRSSTGRIDIVPPSNSDAGQSASLYSTWTRKLLEPFLPVGYPDSVSPDYTAYQGKHSPRSL
jgi:hypothetical protein